MEDYVFCQSCSKRILATTAEVTNGLCMPCFKTRHENLTPLEVRKKEDFFEIPGCAGCAGEHRDIKAHGWTAEGRFDPIRKYREALEDFGPAKFGTIQICRYCGQKWHLIDRHTVYKIGEGTRFFNFWNSRPILLNDSLIAALEKIGGDEENIGSERAILTPCLVETKQNIVYPFAVVARQKKSLADSLEFERPSL